MPNMFSSFFNPGQSYQDAMNQLQQYYQQGLGFEGNFMNQAINPLLNPQQMESQWVSGYQESPYAKQLADQAKTQGLDAASSMGLLGSSPAISAIQAGTAGIVNKDRQQYLNDLMQKYQLGAGLGSQMAQTMGGQAMGMGNQMANLAYGQAAAPGNLFGNLLGMGGSLLGGLLGGLF